MKQKSFLILFLVLIFVSCAENDVINEIADTKTQKRAMAQTRHNNNYQVSRAMVDNFLRISKRQSDVRSVLPMVEEGDTLAYYVEYENGWDLISGDTRLPQILAHSQVGHVDWTDTTNPGVGALRGMLCVVADKRTSGETITDNVWQLLEPQNETEQEHKMRNTKAPRRLLRGEGFGKWIPIDTIQDGTSTTSGKLITTSWHQNPPYNSYTPYQYDANNELKHTKVGCVAVAAGQVINAMRKDKTNGGQIPYTVTMPYVENGTLAVNSYSSNWSLLQQSNYAAMFLSFLGRELNNNYGLNGSGAYTIDVCDLLSMYNIGYSYVHTNNPNDNVYSYANVYGSLLGGSPVIIASTDTISGEGHSYIADAYIHSESYTAIDYVWDPFYELTEWDVVFGDPALLQGPITGEGKEIEGDYSTYVHRYFYIDESESVSFSYNWGWGGSENYSYFTAYYSNGNYSHVYPLSLMVSGFRFVGAKTMIYGLYNLD